MDKGGTLVDTLRPLGHFGRRIGCPAFGEIGQGEYAGRAGMDDALGKLAKRPVEGLKRNLRMRPAERDQLGAAGEEFRRTALVAMDVRLVMAKDGAMGGAQDRQRQGVGGRARNGE